VTSVPFPNQEPKEISSPRDNDTPSELAAHAAEIIRINVQEPSGPLTGVLMYYAVLAYPKREEQPKRRSFLQALAAMRFREFAIQGACRKDIPAAFRRYKREKVLTRTNLGWKRIERRIQAGVMGWCICLNGKHLRYSAPTPDGKLGLILQGPRTVSAVIRAFIENRHAADGVHLAFGPAFANVSHRIWAESLPVLHLAMSNPVTIRIVEAQINKDLITPTLIALDFFASLHEPAWLYNSLIYGENLKLDLAEQLRTNLDDPRKLGYKPERAIAVLPTDDPSQVTRI
jgi:hypothetical protein